MRRSTLLAISLAALLAVGAGAQTARQEADALVAAKRDAGIAAQRARDYEAAATRATDEAARARAEAAALAARVQSAEADIAAAETRVRLVEALRMRQRARLAERQAPLVRLTAALQTMARRPPALALAQPGSLSDAVHVRTLLAATLPVIQERTRAIRAELAEAERLRERAGQAAQLLRDGRARLDQRRAELARIEVDQRRRSRAFVDSAMQEQDRAMALGEEARDIVDLMRRLDRQAGARDRLASLPGPLLRPALPSNARLPGADRPITIARPDGYRLPVLGRVTAGLGEVAESGVRSRGLTLATASGAQVVAPAGGSIAFAGPFEGYDRIVIIDHGGGWTSLVTGLASITVVVGQTVDAGGPLGRTGRSRPQVTVELREGGRPVDIGPIIGIS